MASVWEDAGCGSEIAPGAPATAPAATQYQLLYWALSVNTKFKYTQPGKEGDKESSRTLFALPGGRSGSPGDLLVGPSLDSPGARPCECE